MSTVAHPRTVRSGSSGQIVAGFLVGAALAVAVGYGVVTLGEPVSGELSQPAVSDQVIAEKAAEIAAAKAAAVARGEQMQEINDLGFGNPTLSGAELAARTEWMLEINDLGFGNPTLSGADLAARTERMLEINEFWPVPSASSVAGFSLDGASHALPEYIREQLRPVPSASSAADFGLDGASHALPEYIRIQFAGQAQNAQYDSQIEYLTEQWKAQTGNKLENAGPRSPLVAE